jgi:hypothetical protein
MADMRGSRSLTMAETLRVGFVPRESGREC